MAASALSNSLRRRCALIRARSAVVPLSEAAMFCSSSNAASAWPPARWVMASAVRLRAFVGVELQGLGKVFLRLLRVAVLQIDLAGQARTAAASTPPLPVAAFRVGKRLGRLPGAQVARDQQAARQRQIGRRLHRLAR